MDYCLITTLKKKISYLPCTFMVDVLVLCIIGREVVFYEINLHSTLLCEHSLFFTLNKCNFREIPHLAWEQKETFFWQLIIIIIIIIKI